MPDAVIAVLSVVFGLLVIVAVESRRYAQKHRCSYSGCTNAAWWRLSVVVRASGGERPKMLARLATPFRVCGSCFRDLDPAGALPDRDLRRQVAYTTLKVHGEKPDWSRTVLDREHVLAAWLRRGGK